MEVEEDHQLFDSPWQDYSVFSFERFCYFICLFLLLGVVTVAIVALIVAFVLKPRKPNFAMQALRMNSFTLNASSASNAYASSVVLLVFDAENPNRIGIRYSPSQIHFMYKGIPIGSVEVPKFYQPAHSKNVSVQTRAIFERVNLTQIVSDSVQLTGPGIKFQVVGDIKARLCVLHIDLPIVTVALDCLVSVDYRRIIFGKGITDFMREPKALLSHLPSFSKECSLSVYM